MIHEHLTLSPGTARLWPTLVKISGRFFPHAADQPGWTLGGGTVLTARWSRHRDTTSLDAKVQEIFTDEPRTDLASMFGQGSGWFTDGRELDHTMYRAGGRKAHAALSQRVYEFGEARIDLSHLGTRRIWAAGEAIVENTPTWTEPTVAILHEKLHGDGRRSPVRDLFDVAVAFELDPEALREALSKTNPTRVQWMHTVWIKRREEMKEEGRRELQDVAPRWQMIARDPAAAALDATQSLMRRRRESFARRAIRKTKSRTRGKRGRNR